MFCAFGQISTRNRLRSRSLPQTMRYPQRLISLLLFDRLT